MAHTHEDGPAYDHPPAETQPEYRERRYPFAVRGGFSLGGILTGVAVALGAMLLLTALIGGIVAAVGIDGATGEEATRLGWGAGIGLIVAQLLAYVWGGYTAGRMARGMGWLNGLLVPVTAIVLAVLVGLLIQAFGEDVGVVVPYGDARVPVGIDVEELRNIGLVAGIGSLVAMFVGAVLGGIMGARWHDKLEARAAEDPHLRAA